MALRLGVLKDHLKLIARSNIERIGMIIGRGTVGYALIAVKNTAGNPRIEFSGDPWDIVVAHNTADILGVEVIGIYHTHPSGEPNPSPRDLDGMIAWPYIWVIASPMIVRGWRLIGGSLREVLLD